MSELVFRTVPNISLGAGKIAGLGALAKQYKIQRPFVVTDTGIVDAGLLDVCLDSLREAGLEPELFSDVVAD